MSNSDRRLAIVAATGPAVGKISGINHLVLFTRDMNEGVHFYRDLLGLKVVRTQPRFSTNALSLQATALISAGAVDGAPTLDRSVRQVVCALGNGELFSLDEVEGVKERPDASIVSFLWPPSQAQAQASPQKLDHLAFNVETRAELDWFRDHLRAHDLLVSDVVERKGADRQHRFLASIYFSDPTGNPLEIATFDYGDPGWRGYDFTAWFRDEDPVPALGDQDQI